MHLVVRINSGQKAAKETAMNLITISFIVMLVIVFIISVIYYFFYKSHDKNIHVAVEPLYCSDCEIESAITCFGISKNDICLDVVL